MLGILPDLAPDGRPRVSRPVDSRVVHWTELVLWGACIFLLSSPFTFTLTGHNPTIAIVRNLATMREDENSQWLLYAVRFGVVGVAALFALPRWQLVGRTWDQLLPILPFVVWAALSILWSDDRATTMHSVVSLVTLVIASYLITLNLPPREMAKAVLFAAAMLAASTFAYGAFLPAYAIHQTNDASQFVHAGAWRGVYMHKNFLGQVAALFASAIFWSAWEAGRAKPTYWGLFAVLLLLIGLSTSATALMIVPITLALVWAALLAPLKTRAKALLLAVPGLMIGYLSVGMVLSALGRDATFSGRTVVWQVATDSVLQHPVTGLGYVSMTYGDFSYRLMQRTGLFDPHNAFFDTALGTGLIGLILFTVAVVFAWRAGRRLFMHGGGERSAAITLFSLFVAWLIGGITEVADRPFSAMGGIGLFAMTALLSVPIVRRPVGRRESPAVTLMRAASRPR